MGGLLVRPFNNLPMWADAALSGAPACFGQPEIPMLNQHRPQLGRMGRACAGAPPLLAAINTEEDRAPVTFGWWLYANDRFVGQYHLETLYRLDRVGARLGDHSGVATLQPSEYYGQTTESLREMLRVRQLTLLPRVPTGHRWIGPQLIREAQCSVIEMALGTGKLQAGDGGLPAEPAARLEFARGLASKILFERMSA